MERFKKILTRHFIAFPASTIVWIYLLLNLDVGFFVATLAFIGTYAATLFGTKTYQTISGAKRAGLTTSEYRHIERQVDDAYDKLREMGKNYGRVRSIHSFKQLFELSRLAKRIIQTVEANPSQFYYVDRFFYSHLDSAVDITTRYIQLSQQPVKDLEINGTIEEAKTRLADVHHLLETDLKRAMSKDLATLNMELDYVDLALQKNEPKRLEEEPTHDERKKQ